MESEFQGILQALGENPHREGLKKTPARAAKALQELCSGYQMSLDQVVNGALFTAESHDMVIVKDIELYSLCEHHLLPFIGRCHVAYIPNQKLLGLSKIPRIVDMHAKRLQIQESLTRQIAESIYQVLAPKGVAVVITAEHLCVRMQGVAKQNSHMMTSCMLGIFRDNPKTRHEFLSLIK